jgi:nucleoid DNA-binding protein
VAGADKAGRLVPPVPSWPKQKEPLMTKKEIATKIAKQFEISHLLAREAVQMVFDGIIETLVSEGCLELRNFGVFEVRRRRARKARNPRTGEIVSVAEKNVVIFKPGLEMEQRVNELKGSSRQK